MTLDAAPQPQVPPQPQSQNRGILTILLIILAVVAFIALIACVCLLTPFLLALMGPSIGNVFSNIILNI